MNTDSPASPRAARLLAGPIAGLALAALAGCASTAAERRPAGPPVAATPTIPGDRTAGVARLGGSVRVDTDDARIAQLWSAAQQSYLEGDGTSALEHLYEGLAIAPDNGVFWSRAAEIQLDAEQPAMAENLAVKSNAVSAGNGALQYRNWLIIEHARQMRGDLLGVRSAHRKVQQYQYR